MATLRLSSPEKASPKGDSALGLGEPKILRSLGWRVYGLGFRV